MIKSVDHVVNILNCFTPEKTELGISELTSQLNMNKSTVHHIVKSLCKQKVLVQTPGKKYRLGLKVLDWGRSVSPLPKLLQVASPVMESLVKTTGETVHLAVLEQTEVYYLAKLRSERAIRIETKIGGRMPAYCTGLGKVQLAFQPDRYVRQVVTQGLTPMTPNTISDPDRFYEEMRSIRRQGYAIDNEEYEVGLYCVAAPIRDAHDHVVAAVSLAGPEVRLRRETAGSLTRLVTKAAHQISEKISRLQ
ncbi:IclR family transcriptional regulator [Kyrpidia tusciae]|uniref:Transcriptional regulator, IclR family n=1 Tax=Kyrpidia tusciae (strain DSM 2912 / NBRC 15312 / T2) TaxID=562970 RepID=D5WW63_KYRT2|nr:IclR family transcriptional regulator [Kyrpidia tusciae]ADG05695.1 transcriptional regulator, IclR family [Kyrpidia tusciae DSM 2912]MBE3552119.1 IclR family transcriptional regulator [Kyrpidia tusciae]